MHLPEQINRVLLVGSREDMKATIDLLYKMEALHVIDFSADEPGFSLGAPLPESSVASQKLLKLRSLEKSLQLDVEDEPTEVIETTRIESEYESSVTELDEALGVVLLERNKAQSELNALQNEKKVLEPFTALDLPIELYKGYTSIGVLIGHVRLDPTADLTSKLSDAEVVISTDKKFVAVFVPRKDMPEAMKILIQSGFSESPAPSGTGPVAQRIQEIEVQSSNLESYIEESTKELEDIRNKYGAMVSAADEQLSIEVQMAETPLRIGTTPHAFVIDGWVTTAKVEPLRTELNKTLGERVFLDVLETMTRHESHEHDTEHLDKVDYSNVKEEVPTNMRNGRYNRMFEYLTNLISSPKYREVDPTFLIGLTFPLFFGLMVGDIGYGVGFTTLGLIGLMKVKSPEWKTIATMLFFGGIWAIIFGLFVFGEVLGMHLQPIWTDDATVAEYPFGNEVTWSYLFQMELPKLGVMSKLVDVKLFLFIAIMIGFIHLGIGYAVGIYNKTIRYGFKHALLERVSWLLILIGGFFLMMWFINEMIEPVGEWWGLPLLGYYIYIGLALIIAGTVMAFTAEGGVTFLELPGLMSNVLSYSRLAAIGMSKAGLALVFNTVAFVTIGTTGIMLAFAIPLFVLGVLTVFILAIISAGLHSIRLHYVELFGKFFEGGGIAFNPLKIVRKWTSEKVGE